jgi:hypothetical protein
LLFAGGTSRKCLSGTCRLMDAEPLLTNMRSQCFCDRLAPLDVGYCCFPDAGLFQTPGFSNFPGDEIPNAATARVADCGLFETSFLQCLMYPK